MKHTNNSWNVPFYHPYYFSTVHRHSPHARARTHTHTHTHTRTHTHTYTHTHSSDHNGQVSQTPWRNSTLCCPIQVPKDLPTSSLESHRCPKRSSFIFGNRWTAHGTKPGLFGWCHKMVRGNFSVATVLVQELWGLTSCCGKMFFLCFQALLNNCFKDMSVAL